MRTPRERSSGSHGPLQRAVARGVLAVFLATLPGSPPARADYSGDQLVAGEGSVEQVGNQILIEAADGTAFRFDVLNVWSHEELHATLPAAEARLLLQVMDEVSHFDGLVASNGILYIANPHGIFFGSEAVVDTNGLVAASGTIAVDDFLAGVDRFALSGAVENLGRIEAPRVALLGTVVANRGDIVAPDGTIALVAGERALLTRPGGHLHVAVEGAAGTPDGPAIEQTGTVDAGRGEVSFVTGDVWSLAINHEGVLTRGRDVELRAASGTVQVSGRIDASDTAPGATGGRIAVTGERVALVGAELDASGDAGGGSIHVGGERHGEGALPTAKRTFVDAGSVLRADAVGEGDGGEVVVWADEATAFHGAISARGGALAGRGGFAEISGGRALWSTGHVDLRAPYGETGTLLYDPQDIEIVGGEDDGSDDPDTDPDQVVGDEGTLGQVMEDDLGDGSMPFRIFESEIEGTDANVVLEARNSIVSTGTFTHDAAGEGVGVLRIVDGNSLTLRTRNDAGDADGTDRSPGIDLGNLDVRTGGGGRVTLTTGDGSIAVGGIDTSGADGATGGAAGSIRIDAGDADESGGSDVTVSGDLLARGGAGSDGDGGRGGTVTVRSENGDVTLAAVDTRGGEGSSGDPDATVRGGAGGAIDVRAGTAEDADGDILLLGSANAREGGDPEANPDFVEGGNVILMAAGDLEHGGQAGPHVSTTGNVLLSGRNVGALGRLVVRGSGESDGGADVLTVRAEERGVVHVEREGAEGERAGFQAGMAVEARGLAADLDVTQDDGAGGDDPIVQMTGDGSAVVVDLVDSVGEPFDVQVGLAIADPDAPEGSLVLATGSVHAGSGFIATSGGDLVVGDADGTVVTMSALPGDAGEPTVAGGILLLADADGDGEGALLDAPGSATGIIDRRGDADEAGTLVASAGGGIGMAGDPLTMSGGGEASFEVAASDPELPPDGEPLPEPESDAGLYVRNVAGPSGAADLVIQRFSDTSPGATIRAGTGDIEITNEAGDLRVEGVVSTRLEPPDDRLSPGGDVTLAATAPGSRIVMNTGFPVESGGRQVYDGAVALQRDTALRAGDGVEFQGTVDTEEGAFRAVALDVSSDGTVRFADTVGGSRALGTLSVSGTTPGAGTTRLEGEAVRTEGIQRYGGDVELAAAVELESRDEAVRFGSDVQGVAPDSGLSVLAPGGVRFDGEGDQAVTTGTGGIRFDTGVGASPPPLATVAKTGGGLALQSDGAVELADGEKLTVQGALAITAPTVRVTDLSARTIDVDAATLQIHARQPGSVLAASGQSFRDGGTDIVADEVTFSSAPVVVGPGPAPRVATASGAAVGAGTLAVARLPGPLTDADFVSGGQVLDLGIPVADPGNETPELEAGPVEVPQPLRITREAAAPGPEPDAAEVVAFLSCAPVDGAVLPGCAAPPRPREGSALDTVRAVELAAAFRELLGDAPGAREGRRALADAAAPAGAPLWRAETPVPGRRYLVEVAHLLARARLLGLDDATHAQVRRDVLAAVRDAVGAPGLDLERLEAGVRASRPGLRI